MASVAAHGDAAHTTIFKKADHQGKGTVHGTQNLRGGGAIQYSVG